MATAKKKSAKKASKKAAGKGAATRKSAAPAKAPTRAASKKAATTKASATKVAKKKAPRKVAEKKPSLTRTVNMGPERGDNSFPPSNKKLPNVTSRAPGSKPKGSPAKDSTTGPGGKALEGRGKDGKSS